MEEDSNKAMDSDPLLPVPDTSEPSAVGKDHESSATIDRNECPSKLQVPKHSCKSRPIRTDKIIFIADVEERQIIDLTLPNLQNIVPCSFAKLPPSICDVDAEVCEEASQEGCSIDNLFNDDEGVMRKEFQRQTLCRNVSYMVEHIKNHLSTCQVCDGIISLAKHHVTAIPQKETITSNNLEILVHNIDLLFHQHVVNI